MSDKIEQATKALEKRASLIGEIRSVNADKSLTDVQKRSRVEDLDVEVRALEAHAESLIEQDERSAQARNASPAMQNLMRGGVKRTDEGEPTWRAMLPTMGEYHALLQENTDSLGGVTVPHDVASKWAEYLRQKSAILRIVPASNIVEFDSSSVDLPVLNAPANMPERVDEGAFYKSSDYSFGKRTFGAIKVGAISTMTWELEADSALPLRNMIANAMLGDIAEQVDECGINGQVATSGFSGLLELGTTMTPLSAGSTISYSALNDAYAAVEGTGATPTHVLVDVATAKALRDAEDTAGNRISDPTNAPANSAYGLPRITSGRLPANTAVVVDASRLYFGSRSAPAVLFSDALGFDEDVTYIKARTRVAGLTVIEKSSIQVVSVASA